VEVFGIHLLGLDARSGHKLLLSALVVGTAIVLRLALRKLESVLAPTVSRRALWTEKTARLLVGAAAALLLLSIWFESSHDLALFGGLIAGGIAVASQKLLQAVAGFFVIVFGRSFNLGDRIEIGGVRGDVLDIGLLKTTVMEMGVTPDRQPDPKHWVGARQYTGRIVTIANSEVFEQPVFNYSRDFDYLWDEIQIPLKYDVDLRTAERVALDAARTASTEVVAEARTQLERVRSKYLLRETDLEPRAYVRLTDNWIELSIRFLARPSGIREMKDRIFRRLLTAFGEEGISIASATFEVVGMAPVRLEGGAPEEGEPSPHEMQ